MFSNITIGVVLGIGVAGWVYAKTSRSTGGNTKSALIVAGGVGLAAFILMVIILSFIFKS